MSGGGQLTRTWGNFALAHDTGSIAVLARVARPAVGTDRAATARVVWIWVVGEVLHDVARFAEARAMWTLLMKAHASGSAMLAAADVTPVLAAARATVSTIANVVAVVAMVVCCPLAAVGAGFAGCREERHRRLIFASCSLWIPHIVAVGTLLHPFQQKAKVSTRSAIRAGRCPQVSQINQHHTLTGRAEELLVVRNRGLDNIPRELFVLVSSKVTVVVKTLLGREQHGAVVQGNEICAAASVLRAAQPLGKDGSRTVGDGATHEVHCAVAANLVFACTDTERSVVIVHADWARLHEPLWPRINGVSHGPGNCLRNLLIE